jgi:hypothetical protein
MMSVSPAGSSEDFSVLDYSGEALSVLLVTRLWRFPLGNLAGSTLPANMLALEANSWFSIDMSPLGLKSRTVLWLREGIEMR